MRWLLPALVLLTGCASTDPDLYEINNGIATTEAYEEYLERAKTCKAQGRRMIVKRTGSRIPRQRPEPWKTAICQ